MKAAKFNPVKHSSYAGLFFSSSKRIIRVAYGLRGSVYLFYPLTLNC
jgi:hypothetical protein